MSIPECVILAGGGLSLRPSLGATSAVGPGVGAAGPRPGGSEVSVAAKGMLDRKVPSAADWVLGRALPPPSQCAHAEGEGDRMFCGPRQQLPTGTELSDAGLFSQPPPEHVTCGCSGSATASLPFAPART